MLDRDSGELVYVNAGHNPPIVWRAGQTNPLEATGTALGWFDDTTYDVGRMTIPPEGGLLIYTDGLTDSIPGNSPEDSLYRALDTDLARTMLNLKALVDPRFNEDDVTVLLVKRTADQAFGSQPVRRDNVQPEPCRRGLRAHPCRLGAITRSTSHGRPDAV